MATRIANAAVRCLLLLGLLAAVVSAHSVKRGNLNYLAVVTAPRIHTPSHRVNALSSFDLTFTLHNYKEEIRLTLEPNHDVISDATRIEYLDANGNVARTEQIDRMAHKVFKGFAWTKDSRGHWQNVGWARINIRRDGIDPLFEGAFLIMHDHHHIQMRSSYQRTKHVLDPHLEDTSDEYMVAFRDSDYADLSGRLDLRSMEADSCLSDGLEFNTNPDHPLYVSMLKREAKSWGSMSMGSLFGKRQTIDGGTGGVPGNSAGVNLASTIGSTAGCPSTRRVALVGVATDCTYTADFNSSESVRQNIITQFNSASDLYEKTFNISLGLQTLTVSDAACPASPAAAALWNIGCLDNTTITDRLNEFSQWRGGRGNDKNAYWTLLSTCATGPAVGLAWLGQLCVTDSQSASSSSGAQIVSGANVVVRTSTEWQVIAHESGHTFGAVHDCSADTCQDSNIRNSGQCCPLSADICNANAQYIMNPSTGQGITAFSPCSVGNICSAILRNSVKSDCLQANRGVTTISGNQCGNGIVEEGEDCDCGGSASCGLNNCCDATTCKFKNNAVCDDANDDCCRSCQYASSRTVCRASSGVCDPEETCTGSNAFCPANSQAPNGQSCGNGLTCASGQCTSRDLQCKTLMGSFSRNNDTTACDDQDCSLSCASPEFGVNKCYGMQQNFLDGTTCGGGGQCANGICKGSNVFKEAGSWINKNKALVIGLCSVLGSLLVLAIISCVWRNCFSVSARRTSRHRKNQNSFSSTGGVAAGPSAFNRWRQTGHVPPNAHMRGARNGNGSGRNNNQRSTVPDVPPHWQGEGRDGGWGNYQQWQRQQDGGGFDAPQRPGMVHTGSAVRYA